MKPGTVGRADPGHGAPARRRRRGARPRRQHLPRLPRRPRAHRGGARRRRLAPHRRHRAARRRGLPPDRRPQEGADHHRGRQERLARQPRGGAEGPAAHRAGVRGRRRPSPTSRRCSCSIPTSCPRGLRATARPGARWPSSRSIPIVLRRDRPGGRRPPTSGSRTPSRSGSSPCCPRVASRLARS